MHKTMVEVLALFSLRWGVEKVHNRRLFAGGCFTQPGHERYGLREGRLDMNVRNLTKKLPAIDNRKHMGRTAWCHHISCSHDATLALGDFFAGISPSTQQSHSTVGSDTPFTVLMPIEMDGSGLCAMSLSDHATVIVQ